jgi:type I restriction enzyme R subunit
MSLNESIVEDAALEWFRRRQGYPGQVGELGYAVGHGPHLAPGEPAAERDSFGEVVQTRCARTLTPALSQGEREKSEAIRRPNPAIPEEARATLRKFRIVPIERRLDP